MEDLVVKWNNRWRFDYWYRQKYAIPFNSEAHRQMSQIDIKREYVEYVFMQNESKRWKKKEKDLQEYRETGEWLKVNKEQEEAIYKLI